MNVLSALIRLGSPLFALAACQEPNPDFIWDTTVADGESDSGEEATDTGRDSDTGRVETDLAEPCAAPLWACDEACVDLQVDKANCGACGLVCGDGQSCKRGLCECKGDKTACPDGCFETRDDDDHCGDCWTVCAMDTSCHEGSCE